MHMISIAGDKVNMRSGSGTHYRVLWQFGKGYPLQVILTKSNWYKVRDFEGDVGWVSRKLTTRTPHVVVKKKIVNIRSLPGTKHAIVAKAKRGTVLRTIASVKGWVKVHHEQGVTGWVARRLVWGW